jgi:predicted MFS family arabinose efflux permease
VYGVVVGLPAVIGLPLGVYLTNVIGYAPLFVLAAIGSLGGLAFLAGLPTRSTGSEPQHVSVLRGLRGSGLLMPTFVFAAVTVAAGISVTFVPLAVSADRHALVAGALLVQSIAAPAARWVAGRYSDRVGPAKPLVPALLLAALGAGALVFIGSGVAVVVGAAAFGLGFGAAQNLTLAMMYDRVPKNRHAQVSALWNLAYDGGWGIGAIVFGAVVAGTGYSLAFGVTAAVVAMAIIPAVRAVRVSAV